MGRTQPALFGEDQSDDTELVKAARTTIKSLRDQNAIQEWHELDVAIVIETAKGVGGARGIAKSQMIGQLLAARAKLPEPIIQEADEVVQYEADRELEWFKRHDPDRVAKLQDAEEPAPV